MVRSVTGDLDRHSTRRVSWHFSADDNAVQQTPVKPTFVSLSVWFRCSLLLFIGVGVLGMPFANDKYKEISI